jgi:hypothetical protein
MAKFKYEKFGNTTYFPSGSTVGNAQGDVTYIGGGAVTAGYIYYLSPIATLGTYEWTLADADFTITSGGLLAVALGTGTASTVGMLLRGMVTLAIAPQGGNTPGMNLYLSTSAGRATTTAPTNDFPRTIGFTTTAAVGSGSSKLIWFNTDNGFLGGLGVATGISFNNITALASTVSPVNGTAAVGTSTTVARQDHVHGTDTTRAPLASPTFTGSVTIGSLLTFANPGVGQPTKFVFTKTNDSAWLEVKERSADKTYYEFGMADNPTSSDYFQWKMNNYESAGTGWMPLQIGGFANRFVASSNKIWGNVSMPTNTSFATVNNSTTSDVDYEVLKYTPTNSTTQTLYKDSGTGTGTATLNAASFTGTSKRHYWIKIDTGGTSFSWGTVYNVSIATGVIITGTAQTLDYGVTVTLSTTNHVANDKWTWVSFPRPTSAIGGNPTTTAMQTIFPAAGIIGQVIKGASEQTANLQEWQNSSATVLASISSTGSVKLNNLTASQTLELDASKNIISAAKQTGYNLALSTTATDIKVNGTQALGSLSTLARADHVHPTDTSRAPTVSPTFTGTVVLPSGQALIGPEIEGYAVFKGSTSGATKLVATAVAGSTVLTLPAATDILVGRNTADTLTNKTLNAPTITGAGAIAGVFTGNLTGNVIGNATTSSSTTGNAATATKIASITNANIVQLTTTQTLSGKTLTAPIIGSGATFVGGTSGAIKLQATAVAGNNILTLPAETGTLATIGGTETLEGKTLTSPVITSPTGLVKGDVGLGNVDNTSNATERAAAATLTNKTLTTPIISSISNTGTLTLPTSTDTLVGRDTTDTLTNKTLRRTVESKTTDYNLVASDAGKVILMDEGGVDITIPANVFTAGDEFTIINNSGSATPCLVKTAAQVTMFVVGTAYLNADFTLAARRGIKFICEVGGASPRFYGWRS